MLKQEIIENITTLTAGLLLFSESEYPFIITQKAGISSEQLPAFLSSLSLAKGPLPEPIDAISFFSKTIHTLAGSGDIVMQSVSKRYEALQNYLESHFKQVKVFQTSGIEKDIFIVAVDAEGEMIILQSKMVQT